jgi:hypothetical protein
MFQEALMRKFGTWLVVFVAGLLLGFVPQYWKAYNLGKEMSSCAAREELARVRQSAALTYISATQLNYGVASGYAQSFFSDAQKLQASTTDASVKDLLAQTLASRDKITSDLAKGDAAVLGELQPLVLKLESGQ